MDILVKSPKANKNMNSPVGKPQLQEKLTI